MPRKSTRFTFPPGTPIEVRSNEPEFAGAWFEAIVTETSQTTRHGYTVTKKGPPLITEMVPFSAVRPRPPLPPGTSGYGIHCHVDAFHRGAWWAGVVTGIPGGVRDGYRVCFPVTREEFEFGASEVRTHLEWVKGKLWVPSVQGGGKNAMFPVGTKVEVSRPDETNGPAWFVATVLKVIGKTNFLVEYENLGLDNTNTRRNEIVDSKFIRPSPEMKIQKFNVGEEVEVFVERAWHATRVVEVLPGERYVVTSGSREKMELDSRSIRSLYCWTRGRRSPASKGKQVKSEISSRTRSSDRLRRSNGHQSLPISLTSSEEINEGADLSTSVVLSKRKEDNTESSHSAKKLKNTVLSREHKTIALPFTKTASDLWSELESRSAFKITPQQPHFRGVEKYYEDLREGVAIGYMITYANLVEELREHNVVYAPDVLERKLEALKILESNGFNVKHYQTHYQKLLAISKKLADAEKEKIVREEQILERMGEKERMRNMVSLLDRGMVHMETLLSCMRAEKATIVSEEANIDAEVFWLQGEVGAAKDEAVSATQEYHIARAAIQ